MFVYFHWLFLWVAHSKLCSSGGVSIKKHLYCCELALVSCPSSLVLSLHLSHSHGTRKVWGIALIDSNRVDFLSKQTLEEPLVTIYDRVCFSYQNAKSALYISYM